MNFDLIGEISGEPDAQGISHHRWIELIREHPYLVAPQPRPSINPFTKKATVIQPRPDVARVVVEGKEVGVMSWAEDDSNRINVFGDPMAVAHLAREIAVTLGSRFVAASRE